MWDSEEGLLVQERGKLEHKLKKSDLHPLACCGNSPGKSHKKYCKIDPPGSLPLTSGFGPKKHYSERKKSVPAPQITIQKKQRKSSKSARKAMRKARRNMPIETDEENERSQPQLTNIVESPKLDSYFVGKHNGSKIRRIAERINEIARTADPSMRDKVLNEATVRFNNQTMTLQQFLDSCDQATVVGQGLVTSSED